MNTKSLFDKLESFKSLKENWNSGYSSIPPTEGAYEAAKFFILNVLEKSNSLPEPDIFPVPDGNIQIEWSVHGIDFEIEIYHQKHYHIYFEMYEEPFIVGSDLNKIEVTINKHIGSIDDDFFVLCLKTLKKKEFRHKCNRGRK